MVIIPIIAASGPGDPAGREIGHIHIANVSTWSGPVADYHYEVVEMNQISNTERKCTGIVFNHSRGSVIDLVRAILADVDSKQWLST